MGLSVRVSNIIVAMSIGLLPNSYGVLAAERAVSSDNPSQPLELMLKQSPKPHYGAPVPALITGRVVERSDKSVSGVSGVSVSDGYSVVKTDAQGAYSLRPDPSAVFINVTRPSGYDVQGDWYKPVSSKVDFELKQAEHNEDEFVFIHVTDTHVSNDPRSLEGVSQFVREVNTLTPEPRFVINSGDLLSLSKSLQGTPAHGHTGFRNYVGMMNHLSMPYYNVAGDHTDSCYRLDEFPRGDHRCGKPLYWEYLGPHFFSFEYGKIHFVSVDYGYHLGQRKLRVGGRLLDYPTLQVQPMHIKWLQQDLQNRSPDTFGVTSSEHDLVEYCPGFTEIAQKNDIRLQLVGDDHIVAYQPSPVPYRTGGALAGCWWNPKTEQLCPDLSPQGYLIYRVKGEEMECFYKGLGQRIAFVSHRMGAALKGRQELQAHLVQPRPGEKLEYSVNGKDWQPMQLAGEPFYRKLFSATIDSTQLPEGQLTLQVRSTITDEVRKRAFVVVNGSEPLGMKSDATLTFSVGAKIPNAKTRLAPQDSVDVLWNGEVLGEIKPKVGQSYSFPIKNANLGKANRLQFRFSQADDGMSMSSPQVTVRGKSYFDPRDTAIRKVKTAHWGAGSAGWGGFLVGESELLKASPFQRKQNEFCFILEEGK